MGTNFLPENRASESQPPCPTSMYLINTLGWRWARRKRSEQPQKEHLEHRIGTPEIVTCEDRIPSRGAGRGRVAVIHARKTRGNRGNIGIAPPPDPICPKFAQSGDWRLTLGHMVANVTGNEGNDDRRSPRRSWCLSTTQLQRDRRPPRRRQASRPC